MLRHRFVPLLVLCFVIAACDMRGSPGVVNDPNIVRFEASELGADGSATLSWRVENATTLSIDQGVGDVTGQSSASVSPTRTTTYTLRAVNSEGQAEASATVTIQGTTPTPDNDTAAPTGSFGVSKDAEPPFRNDSGSSIEDTNDNRIVKVEPGETFYAQVAYEDPGGIAGIEVNLVNSSPSGAAGTLDPAQEFFTLGEPTGTCDLASNPTNLTCVYPVTVADDAVNIDELDGAEGEFAYVFRTKVTDVAGNQSDEAIRGYVVVTDDATPNPPEGDNGAPTADFTAEQEEGSLSVRFSAAPSSDLDGDPLSYTWDFGDGGAGSSRDFTKTYREAGDYEVTLTVSDGEEEDSVRETVSVEEVEVDPKPNPKPETCESPVEIPDGELGFAIRAELGKFEGELTCEDLASLGTLDVEFRDAENSPVPISDLEGLQYAVNLTNLRLVDQDLADLSSLAQLASLTKLSLIGSGVADLNPLAGLTNLTDLNLEFNSITDISPLVANDGLDEGDTVNLFDNLLSAEARKGAQALRDRGVLVRGIAPVTCASPVVIPDAVLKAVILRELGRSEGELTCENLAEFETLSVPDDRGRAIQSLEGLQFAVNLTELALDYNSVRDLRPLADLTSLVTLDVSVNEVSDLDPLKNLTDLATLDLSSNYRVRDLSPLAELDKLTSLDLFENQVSDLSPLEDLTNLTILELARNSASDLRPLANLTQLTELGLKSNGVSDLGPLENLINLTILALDNDQLTSLPNAISNLEPLAKLTKLEILLLRLNDVSDIGPLENLTSLTYLDLDSNAVGDVHPLVANDGLGAGDRVTLSFNEPLRSNPQVPEDVRTLRGRGVDVSLSFDL